MKVSTKKIYWLTNHFTYYHDYFFKHLNQDESIDLTVWYKKVVLDSHPWNEIGESAYKAIDNHNARFGLNFRLIGKAISTNSYFVVSGWDNAMYFIMISILTVRNIPFAIFTDTPQSSSASIKMVLKRRWLNYVYRAGSNAKLLVTGEVGVQRARETLGISKAMLINFPFATNNEVFKPETNAILSIEDQEIIFLAIGRIDFSHKGQDVALKALSSLCKKGYRRFKYIVAGVGEDSKRMSVMVKDLGLEDHVINLGWVELRDLPKLFNNAHFTLHSSHEDPFPNAVLESLSCGVPVIGSDGAGSVLERVVQGLNGYVFPDNNQQLLEESLTRVFELTDKQFIKLKKNSRDSALQWPVKYNVEKIVTLCKNL
jgi:glycosyltransferase involved in cell wall biosynthesis